MSGPNSASKTFLYAQLLEPDQISHTAILAANV